MFFIYKNFRKLAELETVRNTQTEESRKKIIFMWNYLEWGGAQIYFLAIMKEAKKDWDVTVILPKNSKPEMKKFIEEIGVKYEFTDFSAELLPAFSLKEKLLRQWRRIRSEIKSFFFLYKYPLKNSVLHIEAAPWQSWVFLAALAWRGNVFVTMHNALPPDQGWRELIWRKRLNFLLGLKNFHLFTANQNAKDSLKNRVTEKNWEKITLTRASINPAEIETVLKKDFEKTKLCAEFGIPANKFVVLGVGQFIDRKGRWVFLEAARRILKQSREFYFVWLTPVLPTGDERNKIEEFGVNEGFQLVLSEKVGNKRAEILKFFRIADVFALPSLFEGLPIAVLEAMALGIPTISTNITAIPEAVKHLETGILVEPGDSDALVEAVFKLKENKTLRKNLSEQGQKFVFENFDERIAAKIAIAEYEKSLNAINERK